MCTVRGAAGRSSGPSSCCCSSPHQPAPPQAGRHPTGRGPCPRPCPRPALPAAASAAAAYKDLRVVEVEGAAPGQQERRLLVAKHHLADVDEALEGLRGPGGGSMVVYTAWHKRRTKSAKTHPHPACCCPTASACAAHCRPPPPRPLAPAPLPHPLPTFFFSKTALRSLVSKPSRSRRRATSMCTGAASSSTRPRASLKAATRGASSP